MRFWERFAMLMFVLVGVVYLVVWFSRGGWLYPPVIVLQWVAAWQVWRLSVWRREGEAALREMRARAERERAKWAREQRERDEAAELGWTELSGLLERRRAQHQGGLFPLVPFAPPPVDLVRRRLREQGGH